MRRTARLGRAPLGLLAVLIFCLSAASPATPRQGPGELLLGSVAMDIPAAMHRRLKPLADYLGRELGRPVALRLSASLPAAVEEIAAGNVDIAYLTPVAYIEASQRGGVRLVAKTVTRGRGSYRLMIVVREDSPIRGVRDLVGKRFAFGDAAATLQRAVVVGAGVRLEELGSYEFLGHFDNIARGVMIGDFEAGIVKDSTAFQWQGKALRVIYASPELPSYNIAVSRRLDAGTARAIRGALLRLDPRNPAHRAVIKALDENYDRFTHASDAEYDVVRALIRPFEE